jgi:hypothetical protein
MSEGDKTGLLALYYPPITFFSAETSPRISMPANMRLDGTRSGKHRFRAGGGHADTTDIDHRHAWILILMAGH